MDNKSLLFWDTLIVFFYRASTISPSSDGRGALNKQKQYSLKKLFCISSELLSLCREFNNSNLTIQYIPK